MDIIYEVKYENKDTGEQFVMEARSRGEAESLAEELFDDGWLVHPNIEEVRV